MKTLLILLGALAIIGGAILGIWLSIWVLLYGGIMQAVNNWGVNDSAAVWGIIRAVFFELGVLPGYLVTLLGLGLIKAAVD